MLQVTNLSFSYQKDKSVLEDFNFTLKKGKMLCVMGESGSGKSTLLKLMYGLLDLNKGSIFWGDAQILGPKFNLVPGFEKFKYVAQDLDLMPYISVAENIKKHLSRFEPEESEIRCAELLEVIELSDFKDVKVKNLSGGQQQRVAIARALAKKPELILLDEPFSAIDNFKKNKLRRNIFKYLKNNNIACILSTHDSSDALSFADKLLVIETHKMTAFDDPKTIYQNPKKVSIAALFDDVNTLKMDGKNYMLYPHQIQIVSNSSFSAAVTNTYFKGNFWLIEAQFETQLLLIQHHSKIEKNKPIYFEINV